MSKQKNILRYFESMYLNAFQNSIFNYQVVLDKIGKNNSDTRNWRHQLDEITQQITKVNQMITSELSRYNDNNDISDYLSKVFQIYCYSVCIQYTLSKMRVQMLKSKDLIISWKDPAPIYAGGRQDTILQLFNDIYRYTVSETDNNLYEIRKTLVSMNTPGVPDTILNAMNDKICARKDGTTLK